MSNEVKILVTAQDKTKGTFSGVKSGLATVAKAAVAMGTAMVVAGGYAVKQASDLNETVNKSKVIFGSSQKVIAKFASTAAKDLGLTTQQAMEAAASFGDMFMQLGFTGKEVTRMSLNVVRLSADLGSFNNLPTADVQERIAAAFRGEFDSLQALVPTINAAKVQQEAMAMTGKKSAAALTQQEKAAATLQIIMRSTERAQGDFAKTSDGLANSLKIARASVDNFAAKVGKLIEPTVTKALNWFIDKGLPAVEDFFDTVSKDKELRKSFKALGDAFGAISDKDFAETLDAIAASLPAIVDGVTETVTWIDKLYDAIVKFDDATAPGGEADLGAGPAKSLDKLDAKITASIKSLRGNVLDGVKKMWRDAKASFIENHSDILSRVRAWVGRVIDRIGTMPGRAKSALSSLARGIGDRFEEAKDRVLTKAKDMVTRFIDKMQELVRKAKEQAGKVKGAIQDKFNNAKDWLYGKGKAVINGLLDGLKEPWQKLKDWVSGIATWIKDHKGPISLDRELLKPAGRALMGGLLEGLKFGFGGVGDFVWNAGSKISDIISKIKENMFLGDWAGKIGSLKGGGNRLLNAIRNTFGIGGGTYPGHGERGASKAWDFMVPISGRLGNAIASFAKTFARQLGVMYVIWNKRIWSVARNSEGWRPYTRYGSSGSPSQMHTNHVHVSLFDKGGMLRGFGMNLSGQPERVLSPTQTRTFDRMVRVMDRGGGATMGNTYIVNAPNYVGDKRDLVKALTDLNRQGRLEVVRR